MTAVAAPSPSALTVPAALSIVLADLENIGSDESKEDAAARVELLISLRSLMRTSLESATRCQTRGDALTSQTETLRLIASTIDKQRAAFVRDFSESG